MTNLNLFGSSYTETAINVNQNLNIDNYLRVYEVLGVNNIQINNFGYIGKDLNLFRSINVTEKNKYPIINISNLNNLDKDTFIVNGDLNCYYYTTFKSLSSVNNTFITLADNYEKNIKINSDINVLNKVISDINIQKISITKSNSTFTKNIIIDKNTNLFDCEVFHINCNNYTTNNLHILNNSNCDSFLNINIKNNLDISNNINIIGNTNIKQSLLIDGKIRFDNNSRLVLPKKSNNVNYGELNLGSLRYNDERNSVEYYLDKKWYSISSLHSSNYKTTLKIHENNNTNSSNNIEFYQNEKLEIELNNNTYNLNIHKKNTNIYSNLNIDGIIKFYPNNININNNLSLNKDTFIDKLLILGNKNTNTNIPNGSLRFNENKNIVELYNNGWEKTKFHSKNNGIIITQNDINIFLSNNKILFNNNSIIFTPNLNLKANLNSNNFINTYNTNVDNTIIFNNKALLNFKDNILNAHVAPNYNTTNLNNYKTLNVNAPLEAIDNLDVHYISNIYYVLANYNNFNYLTNDYKTNDNLINTNLKFIYLATPDTNILIKKLEIRYFINHNNISNIETLDLINLKSKYNILVYLKNNLIYDSESNNTSFILYKNSYYTIQIKLKNTFSTIINDVLLFIRLIGLYYVDSYYNNNIDFLYNIDNSFKNDIEFLNDLNLLKNINIDKGIISKNYFNNKIFINNDNYIKNNTNLLTINDYFIIKNNNIGIGTEPDNFNILKIKSNIENDVFNVNGNSIVTENININNNINIFNNCSVNNINYNNLITNNIKCSDTSEINQNLNCDNVICKNLIFDDNLSDNIHTNSILINNNIYNLDTLIIKNINISNEIINIYDTFRFNKSGNISINSEEIYDAFTIGEKIKPNLSISHNGYTKIYTSENGLILDNINVFNKINNLQFID